MCLKKLLHDKDEKNLLVQILLAFGVKGVALLVSMFSMPLYIKYFDNNVILGIWYTILSMLSWVNMFDLGLGNGLRNRLTEALTVGDMKQAKKYISSTYMALTLIIVPILLIGGVAFWFVDLNGFFNVSNDLLSADILYLTVMVLFGGVCVSFVLKTVNAIIYAVQKSSINNLLSLITSILPLIFIAFAKSDSLQRNLVSLTIVHVIAANLPLLVATVVLFSGKTLHAVMPGSKYCDLQTAKSMLNYGMQFFAAQIFFMFLISTNEVMITKLFSSEAVVEYSIYYRLFTVIGSLFMLALTPLWSKVTKDLAQQNYKKIQVTNRVLYLLAVLATVAELAMVVVLQYAVDLWLGDEAIRVDYVTGLIFAFYGSMYIFNVVLTTVANGIGDLRTQIVFYGIAAAAKIPGILLLRAVSNHWQVVVLYNGLALLLFSLFQIVWIERYINQKMSTQ